MSRLLVGEALHSRENMVTETVCKNETPDYTHSTKGTEASFTRLATEFDSSIKSPAETLKELEQTLHKSLASAGLLTGRHFDEPAPVSLDPEVEGYWRARRCRGVTEVQLSGDVLDTAAQKGFL